MKRHDTRRLLAFALIAVAALAGGCERRDVAAPEAQKTTPDIEERTNRGHASYYSGGNPYARRVVDEAMRMDEVADAMDAYARAGFHHSPGNDFVIEGDGEMGRATITCVMMPHVRSERLALVVRVAAGARTRVTSAVLERAPSGRGLQLSDTDGAWGVSAGVARVNQDFWLDVLECLEVALPSTLAGCIISCAAIVGGYPQCVFTCAAVQSLTATVKCYIRAVINHGRPPREIKKK